MTDKNTSKCQVHEREEKITVRLEGIAETTKYDLGACIEQRKTLMRKLMKSNRVCTLVYGRCWHIAQPMDLILSATCF